MAACITCARCYCLCVMPHTAELTRLASASVRNIAPTQNLGGLTSLGRAKDAAHALKSAEVLMGNVKQASSGVEHLQSRHRTRPDGHVYGRADGRRRRNASKRFA